MNSNNSFKSVIIYGAGNVGWHYGHALKRAGITIEQIVSRNFNHAKELGQALGSDYSSNLKKNQHTKSLVILTLNDDAIPEIASMLLQKQLNVVHTSGSLPMTVLKTVGPNYGVVYPVQSLTKARDTNFGQIPLCIEGSSSEFLQRLENTVRKLSDNVVHLDSVNRKRLHLAAVLVNNFSNFLMVSAADYLKENNVPFELLHLIIRSTAEKIEENNPEDMQTGPAKRGNKLIISEHLEMLDNNKNTQILYKEFSRIIQEYYQK